jgi:hypothetical protein
MESWIIMITIWLDIAALAIGAGHMGTVVFLTGAKSLADISPILLVEVFLLNGGIGLIAGQR